MCLGTSLRIEIALMDCPVLGDTPDADLERIVLTIAYAIGNPCKWHFTLYNQLFDPLIVQMKLAGT